MATANGMLLPPGGVTPALVMVRPAHPPAFHPSPQDEAILTLLRERKQYVDEAERDWREHYRYDTKFASGEQWDESVAQQRRTDPSGPRVMLTLNQMPKFERTVINEERQNRPSMHFSPVDSGADRATARAWQGVVRHIEYDSNADDAYDWAYACVVRGGKGFWRLITEYEAPWSFQQVIKIERIVNPLSVYLDPTAARHPDYHTAQWGCIVECQRKADVQERYQIDASTWHGWVLDGGDWVSQDECLVADYYCVAQQPVTLATLATGAIRYVPTVTETDDPGEQHRQQAMLHVVTVRLAQHGILPLHPGEEGQLVRQRPSLVPVVWWYKTNGYIILERTVWPGQYIPIVPVLGTEYELDGRMDYQGIVRPGIGSQQLFNYSRTMAVETVALAPKAPYIGAEGQFRGHEDVWNTINTRNWATAEYTPVDLHGQLAPPPHRDVQEPAIQGVTLLAMQAAQDLNDTMGIYQAALGAPSDEKSGIAIQRRKAQSQLGTAHLPLNLARAQRWTGRLLLDLVPQIYTEVGRVVRIIGDDGTQERIVLRPGQGPPQTRSTPAQPLPEGISGIYDLSAGRYDVIISTGSYQTKRQENAETLLQLAQVVPAIGQLRPDLLVAQLDAEVAEELARSLKRAVPPALLDQEEASKPEDQVVLLQGQVTQLQQQQEQGMQLMKAMDQRVQELTQENTTVKAQLAGKQGELELKRAEAVHQARMDEGALDLKRQELVLKQYETALDAAVQVGTLREHLATMLQMLRDMDSDETAETRDTGQEGND